MTTFRIFIFCSFAIQSLSYGQYKPEDFENIRKYVASIGTIKYDSTLGKNRYFSLGSGIVCYVKYDTTILECLATAKHVIEKIESENIDTFYIRYSWADSISTTSYFGLKIPRLFANNKPLLFKHSDPQIDIGCVVIPRTSYEDPITLNYLNKNDHARKIFPYNSMANPEIGAEVLIFGYPSHILNTFENYFNYSISTFKQGLVTWKIKGRSNTLLDKIILVESNATYGNSGSPVFYNNPFTNRVELVGILAGGYPEQNTLKLDGKEVKEPVSGKTFYSESRSGVSVVYLAQYVKELLLQVEEALKVY